MVLSIMYVIYSHNISTSQITNQQYQILPDCVQADLVVLDHLHSLELGVSRSVAPKDQREPRRQRLHDERRRLRRVTRDDDAQKRKKRQRRHFRCRRTHFCIT